MFQKILSIQPVAALQLNKPVIKDSTVGQSSEHEGLALPGAISVTQTGLSENVLWKLMMSLLAWSRVGR